MRAISRFISRVHKNQGGQIFVLFGAMLTAIIGFSALAVDVGGFVSDRRDLQNAADAMALAGAIDLPSASAARSAAEAWAEKNGIESDQIESIVVNGQLLPDRPNPEIVVTLKREHEFQLAPVLGIDSTDVSVHAKAIKTSPGGSDGVVPWGVLQSEVDAAGPGGEATLKYDSTGVDTGNFGGLAIDGTGSNIYEEQIVYGSESTVCSAPAVLIGCVDNAPECHAGECYTQPGNMTGPTRSGVDYRITNTSTSCDTFDEVFTPIDDGNYSIEQQCNPFIENSLPSLRVIIVPIIDQLCGGSCYVTINGFALFFLEGYGEGGCSGNHCEIEGRFVRAEITTGALRGIYDENSLLHFIQLTE